MTTIRQEARANLTLALPLIVTQLGTMLMGLVDTAYVGRNSEGALAAVALGNTLVFATTMPAMGIFLAIEPVVSQAIGAREPDRAYAAFRQGMRWAILLSFPSIALAFASLWLLPILHVDRAVIPGTRDYVCARLPGVLPFFVYLAAKNYQQALSRPRKVMEAVLIANVFHAAIGYLAVFGDDGLVHLGFHGVGLRAFGAAGAGITTSISSVVLAGWVLLAQRTHLRHAVSAEVASQLSRKLLRLGVPIGAQLSAEVGVFSMVALLMGRLGGRAAAAHQIAISVSSLSFMGALGVAQATAVRVGNAIGERVPRGARRAGGIGITLGVSMMAGWATVFALAPQWVARCFTHEQPVIEAAAQLIRIAAIFQLADGAQAVSAGALRGAGDTRWPLIANVLTHWCIGLPLSCLFAFVLGWGARGLWFGLTVGLGVIALALGFRFWSLTRSEVERV
ncbi:MAG: MATE family efflux transporter [Polyangiales bacterium]